MDVAKLSRKGQVTIPIEIRRKLSLKEGDKVVFIERDDNVILMNSNKLAFEEFQRDMSGVAERAGIEDEQDVVNLVKEVRRKMWADDSI
jgi:AbrB family looped-hinge helix DNA binding protein